MTTIAIIGDGAMACLCAKLLSGKGCTLRLWSAFEDNARFMRANGRSKFLPELELPPELAITTDAAAAMSGADLVVSAVPSQYTRGVWERVAENWPSGVSVASVTKGIENDTLLRPTQIIADVLTAQRAASVGLVALSGPCIAHEVAQELPATVAAASSDSALAERVQKLFNTKYFRVYTNSDIVGVELAGATKNVVAIAAGILDGLRAGDNAKAALLTRGLVEITRLGMALGGRRETFYGLAGMGDLVTTCVSPFGRNRSLGEAIGQGTSLEEALAATASVVEGVATTTSVLDLASQHGIDMPITQAVYDVLFRQQPPRQAIEELMSRKLKGESD